jgi:glycosyltransferase involved in cell wall biosynthesis
VKVVFLTSNYPPEVWAGTEQVVTAMARELRQLGVDVSSITSSDVVHSGVDVGREQFEGVPVFRLWKKLGEWDHDGFVRPRLLALVRELLRELRPDVVHVHSFAALGIGCLQVCRELGIRVVLTFHDLWVTCARYFRLPPAGVTCPSGTDRGACVGCLDGELHVGADRMARLIAERDRALRAEVALASACTAPSATAARFVRECLPYDGTVHVVPHGVLHAVPAAERASGPRPGAPLRIGTFGNLVAEKGVRELVEAVAGLPCELHLAGRFLAASFGEEVRAAAARAGIRLVERGRYTQQDRHPARDLDLAVFPSKCQETYGLVVDEALAHGVPVVVSDHGAFAERAGTPGVVCTKLAQLRAVVHDLGRSPDRLAALRARVPASLPTIARSAAFHLDLYRRLP